MRDAASEQKVVTSVGLRTPKAGAVAGIVFSILLVIILWLLRNAIPPAPLESAAWVDAKSGALTLALNLVPFAGIAFLWFLGALRDRLGDLEDKFFATVFLGSGLLFLAMLFAAAAILGALILTLALYPGEANSATTSHFARAVAYIIMNVYAIKMAAVFMISTSTVVIYTAIAPRWIAMIGFLLAIFLLFGSHFTKWSFMMLPLWVCLISLYILLHKFHRLPHANP
ncbi:hypothetical protein [Hyphomicrobium sp.]|uniref:hypothetical protein n=1 Tax=Hyphomicrobium sp. TaxID=82 RepID=UPI002E381F52|nr:hypothetical protein [Hyphomicrobium sp.]HEX2842716.1 hypothetical protein [Hyphomicrobium sp.]